MGNCTCRWRRQIDPPCSQVEKKVYKKSRTFLNKSHKSKLFGRHFYALLQIIGPIGLFEIKLKIPK